ncbi:MAG TPA: hypothetical protein VN954_08340 [Ktedonobacteraceae bacterium]|nr:hypothetical protein [Ktedonobacteraceae bacterium]
MNQKGVKQIVVGIAALVLMIMFTACAGVGTTNGNGLTNLTFSGSVVSVDAAHHSVTLNVNGQTKTINNIPDNVISNMQNQLGKFYAIKVTQNSDGTYSIQSGTNVTPEANETPDHNQTASVNQPGSINFIGSVQSANRANIVVKLPDSSTLNLVVNGQTDLSKFNGSLPNTGQIVKVSATASNGSFIATELKPTDSGDLQNQNTVTFQGVTTQAVGSDRVIHFTVGNRSFSYPIVSTADLKDFNGNAQSIANATSVKVKVQFNGISGTAIDVSNNAQ